MNKRTRPDYCIKDVDSTKDKDLNINYIFRQKPKFEFDKIPPFYVYENKPIVSRGKFEMDLQVNNKDSYKKKMDALNRNEIRELMKINNTLCKKAKEDHKRIMNNEIGLHSYVFVSGHGKREPCGYK